MRYINIPEKIDLFELHNCKAENLPPNIRYRELVMRPAVRDELVAERETLLAQLLTYVRSLKDEFSKRTSGTIFAP